MRYIRLREGLSVRVDEIESVEKGELAMTSIVKTHHNTYQSNLPYDVLLELLSKEKSGQEALNILKEVGTFAG